jgi:predicted HAD superfamily Cof-like phosphohydrolase
MISPIKAIYKFNQEAGLLNGYNDKRECAFPIEEALEGFDLASLAEVISPEVENTPKGISRSIINIATNDSEPLSDVDRLDKHLDIIVFSFGSIFKLGLSPQQAMEALGVVMTANMQKLKAGKDEYGKQKKPEGFVGPEIELQKILDKR